MLIHARFRTGGANTGGEDGGRRGVVSEGKGQHQRDCRSSGTKKGEACATGWKGKWLVITGQVDSPVLGGFPEVCVEPWCRTRKSCMMGLPGTEVKESIWRGG